MAKRKRKARNIAEALITDRLEIIERRMTKVPSMTEEEANFVFQSYKILTDAEHSDAEVDFLQALDTKQSNALDDAIIEIQAINAPKEEQA